MINQIQKGQNKAFFTQSLNLGMMLGIVVTTFTACGGNSYHVAPNRAYSNGIAISDSTADPTVKNNVSSSSDGLSSQATAASKGVAPYQMRVSEVGYTSTQIVVKANKVLKVRFTPGVQDGYVAGTGTSPQYSKLGVYITVGTQSQPTPMLSNGLNDGNAQSSNVMDYSSALSNGCADSDTSCRAYVAILIEKPNYDYWCLTTGYYCPYSHVYSGHPWNGTLEIQTDDTDQIQ